MVTSDSLRLRDDFPALRSGTAFFDSPGGTQTPTVVIDAIAAALAAPLANRGTRSVAERNAEEIVHRTRTAMGDYLNADAGGVVFGRSATALTFDMARALVKEWLPGDEIVITRLDHDANIRPWVIAAKNAGLQIRWADFDPCTAELAPQQVIDQLGPRTRLVAVTAASNLVGTKPDVAAISAAAHQIGALCYVDAVHYAAHELVDAAALGADFLVCSPYKFFGPHHGVLAADPRLLETLQPEKLLPSTNVVPERFELGTLPYEMLAGTAAAVDYLAGIAGAEGTRRQRLARSRAVIADHERGIHQRIEDGLRSSGALLYSNAAQRTSTLLFSLPGWDSTEVARRLAESDINAPAGHFYAIEASRRLGLGDQGAVRAGIAPYNSMGDADRLVAVITELADSQPG